MIKKCEYRNFNCICLERYSLNKASRKTLFITESNKHHAKDGKIALVQTVNVCNVC